MPTVRRRGGKISDNALGYLLTLLDDVALLPLQVAMVKNMHRRKQLQPDGLRLHWTTVDGKYQTLDHHADGLAQKFVDGERRSIGRLHHGPAETDPSHRPR